MRLKIHGPMFVREVARTDDPEVAPGHVAGHRATPACHLSKPLAHFLCANLCDFSRSFQTKEFGMAKPRIAIIVGSNRRDSINRKLARALAKLGADKFDASFVRIDDLPMFNQDLEGNLPEEAVRFKSELAKADGVLIVTPEHEPLHSRAVEERG
jgi:hypothetical protein